MYLGVGIATPVIFGTLNSMYLYHVDHKNNGLNSRYLPNFTDNNEFIILLHHYYNDAYSE